MLGLRTIIYKVEDLEEATLWYSKVFEMEPYFKEPFYVGFNIGGYELGLLPERSVKGNNIITYWGVKDIEEAFKKCLSLGATSIEKPNNVGGELMVATVEDLWGNKIGLIYNPYFKL
ncbi:MAG: VOC family protein [Flavobacteriaceae bacterium]|nr:VOC family protein [Flavobacteriaceae bacterium]